MMQRLAVFGGTFNPIHLGHLLIAETALVQANLDQVIWMPSYQPPHRATQSVVNFHCRVDMVQRAIASHPHFTLSTLEASQTGQSFAINTLMALQQNHPDSQWIWVLGMDAFQSLPRWYRCRDLVSRCTWAIAPRVAPRSAVSILNSPAPVEICRRVTAQVHLRHGIAPVWQLLDMPLIDLSSSLIRAYCRDRRSIRYLVPDAVADYIAQKSLYTD